MQLINQFGTRFKGTLGHAMTAGTWKGRNYLRGYRKPKNPRRPLQNIQRGHMVEASDFWKDFNRFQKAAYDLATAKIVGEITAYNAMMKQAMNDAIADEPYVEPFFGTATVHEIITGDDIIGARFVVRKADTQARYMYRFSDASGEILGIGLVAEDQPYDLNIYKSGYEGFDLYAITAAEVIAIHEMTPVA